MKRSYSKKEENDDVEEPYISRAYIHSLLKQTIMRERESPPQAPKKAWRCLEEDIVSSPFNEEMVEFPVWLNDEKSGVEKQCVVSFKQDSALPWYQFILVFYFLKCIKIIIFISIKDFNI